MKQNMTEQTIDIKTIAELKRRIIANAVATGNAFAFRDLFYQLKEFSAPGDDLGVDPALLDRLGYLLPSENAVESPEFGAAVELIEKCEFENDAIPASILEVTAGRAAALGKFAYAEDAYSLLGIKKEMVNLYAQAGEQFLREDKPKRAAMSFFAAASIDQPIGPHYQLLGPQLHASCLFEPDKCVTTLSVELLVDAGIHLLLPNEPLAERLIASARPEQKSEVVATLAVCRDFDFPGLVKNLRAAAEELSRLENDGSSDYSSIGPALLGRETASGEAWQYLGEFCFEHPVGSLCVCFKIVKNTPVLVPVIRDGKSLIERLLPAEFLEA